MSVLMYPDFYSDFVKFAANNPDLREDWSKVGDHVRNHPRFQKTASMRKTAYTEKTARFVNWVTMTKKRNPVSEKDAIEFFQRNFDMEIESPEDNKRSGPRFEQGDIVEMDLSKHKDGHTRDIYASYDGKKGVVAKTHQEDASLDQGDYADILVDFGNGSAVRIPDAQKSRNVGIKKSQDNYDTKEPGESKMIEMVYFSAKERPPSEEQMKEVDEYIERGKKIDEDRVPYYYSGPPTKLAFSQQGNFYFRINPQQRTSKWRSYSPKKGTLLWISQWGQRPSFESDYERKLEKMEG